MAIQVYADRNGIGIFDEGWGKDYESSCWDLRLDDAKSFIQFMYEIMVIAADLGWLPVDVMSR